MDAGVAVAVRLAPATTGDSAPLRSMPTGVDAEVVGVGAAEVGVMAACAVVAAASAGKSTERPAVTAGVASATTIAGKVAGVAGTTGAGIVIEVPLPLAPNPSAERPSETVESLAATGLARRDADARRLPDTVATALGLARLPGDDSLLRMPTSAPSDATCSCCGGPITPPPIP